MTMQQRVGDDAAGFSLEFSSTGSILVTGWGFWSPEVATAFAGAVVDACRDHQQGLTLTFNMRELKPMREEGQRSFSHVLRSLPSLSTSRVSIVTTNPLTKLQLVRLATESRVEGSILWVSETNSSNRDAGSGTI